MKKQINDAFEFLEKISKLLLNIKVTNIEEIDSFNSFFVNEGYDLEESIEDDLYSNLEEKKNLTKNEIYYKNIIEEISNIYSEFQILIEEFNNEEITVEEFNEYAKDLVR